MYKSTKRGLTFGLLCFAALFLHGLTDGPEWARHVIAGIGGFSAAVSLMAFGYSICEGTELSDAREDAAYHRSDVLQARDAVTRLHRSVAERNTRIGDLEKECHDGLVVKNRTLQDLADLKQAYAVVKDEIAKQTRRAGEYGAALAVLGRVLAEARFRGAADTVKAMVDTVSKARREFAKTDRSDEDKRGLFYVAVPMGDVEVKLCPPFSNGSRVVLGPNAPACGAVLPRNLEPQQVIGVPPLTATEVEVAAAQDYRKAACDKWVREFNAAFVKGAVGFQPAKPPPPARANGGLAVGDQVRFRHSDGMPPHTSYGEVFQVVGLAVISDDVYVRRLSDMLGAAPYKVSPSSLYRVPGYAYGTISLYDPSVDMAPRLERVFSVKRAEDEGSIDDLGREYKVDVVFPNGSFIGKHICLTGQAVWTKLLSPGQVNWKK